MWDDVLDRARRRAGSWLAALADRPVDVPVDPATVRARTDPVLPEDGEPTAGAAAAGVDLVDDPGRRHPLHRPRPGPGRGGRAAVGTTS